MRHGLIAVGIRIVAIAAVMTGLPLAAQGQPAYPVKNIRVIVPSPTGGPSDIVARLLGDKLTQALGKQVVVDNRVGASQIIGSHIVAKADPDGYTIGVVGNAISSAPLLLPVAPFDPAQDFSPISLLMSTPLVLVTGVNSPYRSVAEYVAEARAKPGQIAFASGGNATMGHLLAEQLQAHAGLKLIHVPYKGGGPALIDVLAGHVPVFFDTLTTSAKLVQEKKLRALAIARSARSPALPGVPTLAESGYPEIQGMGWFAIVAPANTAREIVAKLNDEAGKALNTPEIGERIGALGGTIEGGPPGVLADLIRSEMPRWARLIRERGIRGQ